jgi:hypothetical protein
MPVSICPRCQHVNPEYAVYCHFDGVVLQAHQDPAMLRLPNEFTFPSGRRCKTFDELAQGCQEEWATARDLLIRGVFAQFFRSCGRADLVRAADDAKAQSNSDIGLTTFVTALPGTRTQTPKMDLHPRRILVGKVLVGESKAIPLTVTNQGQGILQGTVTVTDGQDWLSLSDTKPVHQIAINTVREQVIRLIVNTKGVAAGQTYGAKLTVVTNGGVVEVPLRMDLASQPFTKAPFQGVRTQREMAERMRIQPKAAGPVLESGDVQRWFALNGWNYPVHGAQIKGVGGVQQFFEGMGVSKPPIVHLSKDELRVACRYKDITREQVTLQTTAKKWVYAQVTSDSPWLKTPNPQVSGPQHASVPLEIDTNLWNLGGIGEGKVTLEANGAQKLTLKVIVEVQGAPALQKPRPLTPVAAPTAPRAAAAAAIVPGPPPYAPTATSAPLIDTVRAIEAPAGSVKFVPALITTVLVCLALRVLLIPFVDVVGRSSVANSAATKLGFKPSENSDFAAFGGWLQLPWLAILGGADSEFSADVFQRGNNTMLKTVDFRHYFGTYFIRWFMLWTWWIGALIGAIRVLRGGGGAPDLPWGIVAGTFAGFTGSATLASFFLVAEIAPHAIWHFSVGAHGGVGFLLLWALLAVMCWLVVGAGLGILLPWIGPLRHVLIDPCQRLLAQAFDAVGLKTLAAYWVPT